MKVIRMIGLIIFSTLIGFTAGCGVVTFDTGTLGASSGLRIVNNYNAPVVSDIVLYKDANNIVWKSSGVTIDAGKAHTFTDVPVGTWQMRIGSRTVDNVRISSGMTTTVIRDAAGANLTVQ